MTYALIHPPQAEPLTLAEVKAHLRLDGGDEDALLAALIRTAREHLERTTGLCLIRQTRRLYLDRWPPSGMILIGKGPVQNHRNDSGFDGQGARPTSQPPTDCLTARRARRGCGCATRQPRTGDERHRDRLHCRLR